MVDQIRVEMWNAAETTLLFEAFLPVYFRSRNPTNIVTHVELSPDTPNIFKYDQDVNLTFNYTTNYRGGVQIFARPFSGANLAWVRRARLDCLFWLRQRDRFFQSGLRSDGGG